MELNSTQIIWSSVNSFCRTKKNLYCSRTNKKSFAFLLLQTHTHTYLQWQQEITEKLFLFHFWPTNQPTMKRCWFVAIRDMNGSSTSKREYYLGILVVSHFPFYILSNFQFSHVEKWTLNPFDDDKKEFYVITMSLNTCVSLSLEKWYD